MESIEQTIVDLGSIYQQLATLIKEQDEVIQRFTILIINKNQNLIKILLFSN